MSESYPYSCPECNRRYSDEFYLLRHLLEDHLRLVLVKGIETISGIGMAPKSRLINQVIYPDK